MYFAYFVALITAPVITGLLLMYAYYNNNLVVKKLLNDTLNFSFYFVTWNVGSKYPDNLLLNSLLGLEKNPENDLHLPDFYIVCLQEVNSQPQNVVMGLFKDDPWTSKLKELLKPREYVVVQTEQMQGLLIIFLAKRKHLLHLREIETEYTRTGLGGIWGNKGAVSIRFTLYNRSFCCVNAHLAAHDHMLEERIQDYQKIVKEHKFHVKYIQEIFGHDYVFWMGDLNFRLRGETTTSAEMIRDAIEKEKIAELLQRDQLRLVMEEKLAFKELSERPPAFPPTFKFEVGTSNYDMKRRPAWTDRILYRVTPLKINNVQLEIEQMSYKSHPTYNLSDHKPVTSEFIVKFIKTRDLIRNRATATSETDSIHSDNQAYGSDDEPTVEFSEIPHWTIGEENTIEYNVPDDFDELESDWIGIYRADFGSLNEYLSYEYTNRTQKPSATYPHKRRMDMTFTDSDELPEIGQYVLVYFQSTGARGVTGLAGISQPFQAERRSASPRFDSID